MLGSDGVPDIIIKRALMEFFNLNWFEVDEVSIQDRSQALVVLEVESEQRERMLRDSEKKD